MKGSPSWWSWSGDCCRLLGQVSSAGSSVTSCVLGQSKSLLWVSGPLGGGQHLPSGLSMWGLCFRLFFPLQTPKIESLLTNRNPDILEHARACQTIGKKCFSDSAWALTIDKGKEKAHGTMILAFSLLSPVIRITGWPIPWIVKKKKYLMWIQLDCVIQPGSECCSENEGLAHRPWVLHSQGISIKSNPWGFNEE